MALERTSSQPYRESQKIVIGTNGAAGFPAMTGTGGHPGPPEVMMKGGLRGHHGRIRLILNRKSTSTRARLRVGRKSAREDLARSSPHVETMVG